MNVVEVLQKILAAVDLCCNFCATGSRPVKVLVVVTCEDGLSHEWEREV